MDDIELDYEICHCTGEVDVLYVGPEWLAKLFCWFPFSHSGQTPVQMLMRRIQSPWGKLLMRLSGANVKRHGQWMI